jgi:prohibitin 1
MFGGFGGLALLFTPPLLKSMLYTVDGGERAIIYDIFKGIENNVIKGEGMHFKMPFVEKPIIFDVRIKGVLNTTVI